MYLLASQMAEPDWPPTTSVIMSYISLSLSDTLIQRGVLLLPQAAEGLVAGVAGAGHGVGDGGAVREAQPAGAVADVGGQPPAVAQAPCAFAPVRAGKVLEWASYYLHHVRECRHRSSTLTHTSAPNSTVW